MKADANRAHVALPNAGALDRTDRQILRALQADGRISMTDLAKLVNLSDSPCVERVRRLERNGFILGYTALLNPYQLGASLLAFVQVRLTGSSPQTLDAFHEAVRTIDEVSECHMIAGGIDYLLKIRLPDTASYGRFLTQSISTLPGVGHTQTFVVMEEVKATHLLTI